MTTEPILGRIFIQMVGDPKQHADLLKQIKKGCPDWILLQGPEDEIHDEDDQFIIVTESPTEAKTLKDLAASLEQNEERKELEIKTAPILKIGKDKVTMALIFVFEDLHICMGFPDLKIKIEELVDARKPKEN